MDRIKIAKELVRLAKNLVSSKATEFSKTGDAIAYMDGFRAFFNSHGNVKMTVDADYTDDKYTIELWAYPANLDTIPESIERKVRNSLIAGGFDLDDAEDADDLVKQKEDNEKGFEYNVKKTLEEEVRLVITMSIDCSDFENKLGMEISERYECDNSREVVKKATVSPILKENYSSDGFKNWFESAIKALGIDWSAFRTKTE